MCGAGANPFIVLGVTPANVPFITLLPWQVAHPEVIPVWLNAELLNLAPFGTGVTAILELLPTWQFSHPSDPIGIWVLGGVTIADVGYFAAFAVL